MRQPSNFSLVTAVALSLSLSSACGSKKNSSDPATDTTTTSPSSNPSTTSKSGSAATVAVTVSTVGSNLSLTTTLPATVSAYALKLGSDKKIATPSSASATGKVDAKGKAGLKLAPGYYEIVAKMADGTEQRSSVMHVVKPRTSAKLTQSTTPKPLVVQLDNDTKVARDLAKRVISQDPDLYKASGLNLGLVFKEAQNLQNAATKKKTAISDKDKAAVAKAIASETKKNATSVNGKAAQKKTALSLDDSEETLDAYGQTMSALDEQAMSTDIAAKYTAEDVDPRKLYRDAEAALAKAGSVDADVFKEMQGLDSDDIALAIRALTGDEIPDLLEEAIQEAAMVTYLEYLDQQAAIREMTADQYSQLLAILAVELESRDLTELDAILAEIGDGDVAANTTDPLLQILAVAEDQGTVTQILAEATDVSSGFSADEQTLLTAYTEEAKSDAAADAEAAAEAAEQQKAIDAAAEQADSSIVE